MDTQFQKKRKVKNLQINAQQSTKGVEEFKQIQVIKKQESPNDFNEVLSPVSPSNWEQQTPLLQPKEVKLPISPKKERKQKVKQIKKKAEKLDLESCMRVLTYGVTSETNSPAKRQTHDVDICNVIVPCLYCPLAKQESPENLKHAATTEKFSEQIMMLRNVANKIQSGQKLERANSFEDEENKNEWFVEEGFNKVKRRGKRLLSITEKGKILKYGFGQTAHDQDPSTTASFGGLNVAISVPKKH